MMLLCTCSTSTRSAGNASSPFASLNARVWSWASEEEAGSAALKEVSSASRAAAASTPLCVTTLGVEALVAGYRGRLSCEEDVHMSVYIVRHTMVVRFTLHWITDNTEH